MGLRKPAVEVKSSLGDDPTFISGEDHICHISITNPTAWELDYMVELIIGGTLAQRWTNNAVPAGGQIVLDKLVSIVELGTYPVEVSIYEWKTATDLGVFRFGDVNIIEEPITPPPSDYFCECRMDPFTPYDEEGFINETTFRAGSIQNLNFWYSQSSLQDGSPIAVRLRKIYYGPMGFWDTGEQPVWWPVELTPYGAGNISVPVRAQSEIGTFESYVVIEILDESDNVVCQYRSDGPDITII